MSFVTCPYCDKDISEEAKKCPHCGKKVKKSRLIIPIIIGMIVLICIGGLLGWKIQKKKQQEKIDHYLAQVEELYADFDFDEIEKCYEALDELKYDTSKQREILEYDRNVYEDAYAYYIAIHNVDDKLHRGGYGSLRGLIDTMKNPTKKFEALEINTDSEIGKYINGVRNSIMYQTFNSEFVNNTKYDLDYGLTSWGYVYVIESYTEQIVGEKSVFDKDDGI